VFLVVVNVGEGVLEGGDEEECLAEGVHIRFNLVKFNFEVVLFKGFKLLWGEVNFAVASEVLVEVVFEVVDQSLVCDFGLTCFGDEDGRGSDVTVGCAF
jgi:hypothetical protein